MLFTLNCNECLSAEFVGETSVPSTATLNKRVFSYLRTLITWYCPHSSTAAAAINRYSLLLAGPTAANLQQRRAAAGWDRRTDGQTPDRCVEPGPHTTRAVAAKWADYPNDRIRIIEKIETKVRP